METVGIIGLGKIGGPIALNLLARGYRVVGYRRGDMTAFREAGGIPASSAAEVGAACDIVFSCLPSDKALESVVNGADGLAAGARPGQIIAELGSHALESKQSHVATFAGHGAFFLDGEVAGTPGMVIARKGVVFLGGNETACAKVMQVVRGFADSCYYFGPFGSASRVKLISNLLVAIHVSAAAEAMALGLKCGVDVDMMIEAIAAGSGGSTQFALRAPAMAQGRYLPAQGSIDQLSKYFGLIAALADEVDVATPLLDRAAGLFAEAADSGLGAHDVAVMVRVLCQHKRSQVARAPSLQHVTA